MTYEEKEKQEQKAREITAGKLAKIAEILGYSFDEERRALNPPNEYLPNLHCRYCDYHTRDKIEITSHANHFNKTFATITVSQARSVESLASDIKRRAIDAVKSELHAFRQEEQKRLAEEATERQEITELFAAYSESGFTVYNDNNPTSKDGKFSIRKNYENTFTINAEVNSKYALLQIIKILKEDAK